MKNKINKYFSSLVIALLAIGCAKTPSDFAQKYRTDSKNIQMIAKGEKVNFDFIPIKKISSSSCDS